MKTKLVPFKEWYQSKTLWVTVLTALAEITLLATQMLPLNQTVAVSLLFINACIAVVLRLITQSPIKVSLK